jgi:energy-coupling factor transport system substrate-specific component
MIVKQITLLSTFLTIIITTEVFMSFLPNISLTPLFFALYFTRYPYGLLLIVGYIILQGIIWGVGLYLISMTIGWVIWWVSSKNGKNLTIKSILFAFVYGWVFMPLTVIVYGIDPVAYLMADIPFQINMAISNVLTIGFIYPALDKVIR